MLVDESLIRIRSFVGADRSESDKEETAQSSLKMKYKAYAKDSSKRIEVSGDGATSSHGVTNTRENSSAAGAVDKSSSRAIQLKSDGIDTDRTSRQQSTKKLSCQGLKYNKNSSHILNSYEVKMTKWKSIRGSQVKEEQSSEEPSPA